MVGAELPRQPLGVQRNEREVLGEAVVQVTGNPQPLRTHRVSRDLNLGAAVHPDRRGQQEAIAGHAQGI